MHTNTSKTVNNNDVLDLLLKLSHVEREAVMKELKAGDRMSDKVEVLYSTKTTPRTHQLSFFC